MATAVSVDVLIVGGGIAGLWTLARLKQAGYKAVLTAASSPSFLAEPVRTKTIATKRPTIAITATPTTARKIIVRIFIKQRYI